MDEFPGHGALLREQPWRRTRRRGCCEGHGAGWACSASALAGIGQSGATFLSSWEGLGTSGQQARQKTKALLVGGVEMNRGFLAPQERAVPPSCLQPSLQGVGDITMTHHGTHEEVGGR